MTFFNELKRRNVFKVAAAYAVASWILIEAGSVLLPTFGAPDWVFKAYVLLVFAGFVLALGLSWVLEWTADGVRLEKDVDRSAPVAGNTGRKFNTAIIGMLVLALGISVTLNITGLRSGHAEDDALLDRRSIAVLPFTSRSTDPENAIFTDGIHDDLLTSLANIDALKVISRTSVMEYRDTTKNLRQIGEELKVGAVLEGAVQRSGDNVRINVQFIDAKTDKHIWAETYDRALTVGNIFSIQSEIAEEIASALRTELTLEEQVRLAVIPTSNLAAYRLVQAGRDNLYKRQLETLQEARTQFEQAIELDPDYAEAYAGLADSILLLWINHNAIVAQDAHRLAQSALDTALTLDPQSADAHASLGLLINNRWQFNRSGPGQVEAEKHYDRAIELNPNHARAYTWSAALHEDTGEFTEAIRLYEKALELDPLSRISRSNLAGVYALIGQNTQATRYWLDTIRIHPGWPNPYDRLSRHMSTLGRLDESMAWGERARELSSDPIKGGTRVLVHKAFGEIDAAIAILGEIPQGHPLHIVVQIFQRTFIGDNQGALALAATAVNAGNLPRYALDIVSDAAALIGDYDVSLDYCLRLNPQFRDNPNIHIDRLNVDNAIKFGWLLLQQGDAGRARPVLTKALNVLASMPRQGHEGHGIRDVQVLALLDRGDEAMATLREAVDVGFRGSEPFDHWTLVTDPYLQVLRERPEFAAIVEEISVDVNAMHENVTQARQSGSWSALLDKTRASVAQ